MTLHCLTRLHCKHISPTQENNSGKNITTLIWRGRIYQMIVDFARRTSRQYIHFSLVHEGEKPYKCDVCDASFISKFGLNKHIASIHEGRKPYQCESCTASFATKHALKYHTTSVHENLRPFQCEICETSF